MALDGGEDGLDFYRSIADKWRRALNPGGSLLFECGYDQAQDVENLMKEYGFSDVHVIKDTISVERVVIGRLPK